MSKVVLCLAAAVLVTIAAADFVFNATTSSGYVPGVQPWVQDKMEFIAWNDEPWTAWVLVDSFEQLPQNKKKWSRHANGTLAFLNWEGEPWQAKIDGNEFLLADRGNWSGPIERSSAIHYRDWAGKNDLRTVVQLRR